MQVLYFVGAIVGALLSAALAGTLVWKEPAHETGMGWLSLPGGIALVFGARLAGGALVGNSLFSG